MKKKSWMIVVTLLLVLALLPLQAIAGEVSASEEIILSEEAEDVLSEEAANDFTEDERMMSEEESIFLEEEPILSEENESEDENDIFTADEDVSLFEMEEEGLSGIDEVQSQLAYAGVSDRYARQEYRKKFENMEMSLYGSGCFCLTDINGDGVSELFNGPSFYFFSNGSMKRQTINFSAGYFPEEKFAFYPGKNLLYSAVNDTRQGYFRLENNGLVCLCEYLAYDGYYIGNRKVSYSQYYSYAANLKAGASKGETEVQYNHPAGWERMSPSKSGFFGEGSEQESFKTVKWKLDAAGTLTIWGSGKVGMVAEMDWNPGWYIYADQIQTVILEEGITGIEHSLAGLKNLTMVFIPKSVNTIGSSSFFGCSKLTHVCYAGSSANWSKIKIDKNDKDLLNARIHYNYPITGWVKSNGKWYYCKNGKLVKGWLTVSGKKYFMNSKGVMVTGWKKIAGKWYYFSSGGSMKTGWLKQSGCWYYLGSNGAMQIGWVKDSGKTYFMNSKGVMVTGWKKITGKWYYFSSGGAMKTGWLKQSGSWYYLASNGVMQVGWVKDSGKTYFMNSKGVMVTGWKKITGKWYYFSSGGSMKTGWLKQSGYWYYLASNGVMQVGWKEISGTWYYFDQSGRYTKKSAGWKQDYWKAIEKMNVREVSFMDINYDSIPEMFVSELRKSKTYNSNELVLQIYTHSSGHASLLKEFNYGGTYGAAGSNEQLYLMKNNTLCFRETIGDVYLKGINYEYYSFTDGKSLKQTVTYKVEFKGSQKYYDTPNPYPLNMYVNGIYKNVVTSRENACKQSDTAAGFQGNLKYFLFDQYGWVDGSNQNKYIGMSKSKARDYLAG